MNTDISKIFLEYLETAEIPNHKYLITFTDIHSNSGKMNLIDKKDGKKHTATFIVTNEPFSARVYITVILLGAKFWKMKNEHLNGSHLMTSRVQSLYQKLDAIVDIY